MHSSQMCTNRLLTVSRHALHRDVSAKGAVCPGGSVYPGGVCPGGVSQHAMGKTTPRGQTDTGENITFANLVCGR